MAELDPRLPFTRAEARGAGITDWQLRGHQRLHRDVYVGRGVVLDARTRALAALKLAPDGALIARHTAAELLGAVVPTSALVHLVLPSGRVRAQGVDARTGRPRRRATIGGVPVTTAEDTFVGLGSDLGLVDLVVLGDALVSAKRATAASLRAAAVHAGGAQGPTLRRAAHLVRAAVDSPMESRLRMLMVLAGLPEPVVNHTELDDRGWVSRRFDLSFPTFRLAIEYDGRQHAESDQQWEHDVARREGLDEDGWRIVVVLSKGIYRVPDRTLARIERAMLQVGMRVPRRSTEWLSHFPVRGQRPRSRS